MDVVAGETVYQSGWFPVENDGLHREAILALFTVSFVLNFASSDLNEQQFSPTQS